MNDYRDFAFFYDRLTTDVQYPARADYLLSLFEKHAGCRPASLVDVGCGSGSLTVELARRGVDMTGVDLSEQMLALAADKAAGSGLDVLLLRQDMRKLDLFGTVSGAICTLDSLNHLLRTADLAAVFSRLRLFVEPGGWFIFDVNTPEKHRMVLGDHDFVFEEPDFVCTWRNRFLERTCEVEMELDFFVEQNGLYRRLSDTVRERAYSCRTLKRLLGENGFSTVAVYGDMTFEEPETACERWVFVTRRGQ